MNKKKQTLLDGIIVPLVTPMKTPDEPDINDLRKVIDRVIDGGVDGIFILGTTGECPDLSYEWKCRIIEESCSYAGGRTTVFVGIINTPLNEAIELTKVSSDNKVDCMVLAAPYYPISQEENLAYCEGYLQQCPLPVCFYNRPGQDDIVFKIEVINRLLRFKNVIGIKDSSANMDFFKEALELKKLKPDWAVSMGYEHLVAGAVPMGADGGITGGANLFPSLYVKLYNAAVSNNKSEVQRLQAIVESIVSHVYNPDYLMGLKYALSCKNICSEIMADRSQVIDNEQKKMINSFLETFDEKNI